jgi:ADP-ribose pyrophosphatase YjhB (NUDIX family)
MGQTVASPGGAPTVLDRGFQLAYVCAYQLMRAYWRVKRPLTHGALVALWNQGEILLVKNSYVRYYSLPGGYVHSGEEARAAAVRELREETGLDARADQLKQVLDVTHDWEGKRDHVEIFALEIEKRPEVHIDHREVVEASWFTKERALALNLFPPLRTAIEARG